MAVKRLYLLGGILLMFCLNLFDALDGDYRGGFGRTVGLRWSYEEDPNTFILLFLFNTTFLIGLAVIAWIYVKDKADEE